MTQIDLIYRDLVLNILNKGQLSKGDVRAKFADGSPAHTYYLPNATTVVFTPEMGLPLITTKPVATKSMIAELDWIWRQMSNNVQDLRDMGSTIWDEWERNDGTIGKAYGYQLAKKCRNVRGELLNQVEYVLHELKHNKNSRRIMTTLYDVDDLDDMALEPCVFMTNWQVDDAGRLHLNVVQRSADLALGVPFNWAQYGVLHRRIAQCLGYELGNMSWTIFNAHVYERHAKLLREQVTRVTMSSKLPTVLLPENNDFFGTPLTEIKVDNYKPYQHDLPVRERRYRYEVAI